MSILENALRKVAASYGKPQPSFQIARRNTNQYAPLTINTPNSPYSNKTVIPRPSTKINPNNYRTTMPPKFNSALYSANPAAGSLIGSYYPKMQRQRNVTGRPQQQPKPTFWQSFKDGVSRFIDANFSVPGVDYITNGWVPSRYW